MCRFVVLFHVGRLHAQCWKSFIVWPFVGRIRREAVSVTSREAWGTNHFGSWLRNLLLAKADSQHSMRPKGEKVNGKPAHHAQQAQPPWTHGGRQCPSSVIEAIHGHTICRHRTHMLPLGWCSTVVLFHIALWRQVRAATEPLDECIMMLLRADLPMVGNRSSVSQMARFG